MEFRAASVRQIGANPMTFVKVREVRSRMGLKPSPCPARGPWAMVAFPISSNFVCRMHTNPPTNSP